MNEENVPPEPPEVLGSRGAAFWRELQAVNEFEAKETALLLEACRTLDRITELDELVSEDGLTIVGSTGQKVLHPAIAELRQQQAAFGRLVGSIELEEDEQAADLFRHRRAKAGADARWRRPPLRVANG
ncbi:hypothetical protein [Agromyces bauzanensis]